MQPGQLGRDRDDVDRRVIGQLELDHVIGPSSSRPPGLLVMLRHLIAALAWRSSSARGSSPAVTLAERLQRLAGLAVHVLSAPARSTVTSRSPVVAVRARRPLPRTRSVRPFGVPAGTRRFDRHPVQGRHLDLRAERRLGERDRHGHGQVVPWTGRRPGAGVTCTRTYRSPAGPPRSPGAPLPVSRIRCPSRDPGGDPDLDRPRAHGAAAARGRSGTGRRPPGRGPGRSCRAR